MKILVLIPARIGSVSISKKNLQKLNNYPLLVRAAKKIKKSKHKLDLFISTESRLIMSVCNKFKIQYIKRPKNLAKNTTSSVEVLLHALKILLKKGKEYNILACVQCTSPFFDTKHFDDAVELVLNKKADTAFTASRFHGFLWGLNKLNSVKAINHNSNTRVRRQDRPTEFNEDGAIKITKVKLFLKSKSLYNGKIKIIETPVENNLDINEKIDLKIAKIFEKYLFKK
jgi:CMP-N-acetylneuraminic acid synthetase